MARERANARRADLVGAPGRLGRMWRLRLLTPTATPEADARDTAGPLLVVLPQSGTLAGHPGGGLFVLRWAA